MTLATCLLLAAAATAADPHVAANPVYRALREKGVALGENQTVQFPAPAMADGLDDAAQQAVLKQVLDGAYPLARFLDKSVVAPNLFQTKLSERGEGKTPLRRIDAWFVAYGTLDKVADKDFLDRLLETDDGALGSDDQGRDLTAAELADRKISITEADKAREGYARGTYLLLNRVRLDVTARSYWSRSGDSLVAALVVDPRFVDDATLGNQWRAVRVDARGAKTLGPPSPYRGGGLYVKIVPLKQPDGALWVECHGVFAEPEAWFEGTNLLGSKLPALTQGQVRSFRRKLLKAD